MVTSVVSAIRQPERRAMSYEEYVEFAGETRIVEWVDGEAIVYMPPLYEHQVIVSFLNNLLRVFNDLFHLGTVIVAPFAVRLWPGGPVREPDLLFVRAENLHKLSARQLDGAPDLVIEIVSPGSVTEDRVRKFAEYEQAGVPEYWLIDPRPHQQQADFYHLSNDGVYQPVPLDENGIFRSRVLPQFWLNVAWLWTEPLPNAQLILATIVKDAPGLPEEVKAAYRALYHSLS